MSYIKIGIKGFTLIIIALTLYFFISVAFLGMKLPFMNINREVTQHSQEYVETKRSLLLSLIVDAESAQTPEQKIALINRFCEEYSYVDFDVSSSVNIFAGKNCN